MQNALITTTLAATVALGATGLAVKPAMAGTGDGPPLRLAQNNGPNLFMLYQQIQRLQQQVRELNGQVDTLQYKLRQNEQGQRDLYQNLDKRLSRLENGGGANGAATSPNQAGGYGGAIGPDSAAQSAYMNGFNKLKNGQYDAAIGAFKQFVARYPDTSLTDNAWYWLGEAYYVQQQANDAEEAFDAVVNKFKNSPKVPASLYKIGLIQATRGQIDNAKSTLQRVVDQYPNSDSAGLARQKLQSLGSG
ncbi:tol-pal system protein YbgF [Salinisphaera sp.]|uniref:tol-pal system protein YbgF n=1 Tax=Salinisphaera sp. TaxID=1914330 RepID=UPI002D76BC3D|nr:tol-pal system protein YbgF [Salinisphaera sp.]HET7314333.1 tol-pal system protein YbgF [Salinisphaera sp.]